MSYAKVINLQKILYPEEYKSDYVFMYMTLNDELKDLIGKSGYEKKFKIKFHDGLRFLENLKSKCFLAPNLFENLIGSGGIYSMKLHGQKNIRILFVFEKINNREIAVLLNCFEEKKTKDYVEEIAEAKARWEKIVEV